MRRVHPIPLILLGLLLLLPGVVAAQDTTPPPVTPAPVAETIPNELAILATDVAEKGDFAGDQFDRATNFLGIFEAIGLIVSALAVVGAIGGALGLRNLQTARDELQDLRKQVEEQAAQQQATFDENVKLRQQELANFQVALTQQSDAQRQKAEEEILKRQAEMDALRTELEKREVEQRKSLQQAIRALSLLPIGEKQYKVPDYEGARQTYEEALRLDSNNLVINYRLGYVHTQMDNLEAAEKYLNDALAIDSGFAPALAALGYTYRRMAEKMPKTDNARGIMMARAEETLRQALMIAPNLVDDDGESWWGSLGGLHRRRDQIEDAIIVYNRAGEVTPLSSYPFSNLALLYMMQGDREKMLDMYKKVEKLAKREVEAEVTNYWGYADLLTARLAQGKIDEAEDILETMFAAAPKDSPFALDSLLDTMRRLISVLPEADAAKIRPFIERIQAEADKRKAEQEA